MPSSRDPQPANEPKVDLTPPDIIGVLDPVPGGEENLLPKDAWLVPLRVEFELWDDAAPEPALADTLRLFWKGEKVDEKVLPGPVQAADLWLNVPPLKLEEGVHALYYEVVPWNTSVPRQSVPVNVTIDKTPPALAADSKLIFPAAVLPPNKLTAHYLEQNNNELKANLPRYTDPHPWDRITWYWGSTPTALEPGGVIELDDQNYDDPIVVTISADLIEDRENGWRYVWYQVEDRAGNPSLRSELVELEVDATPTPRDLPWPSVEGALGTGEQQTLDPWVPTDGVVIVQVPDTAVIYPGEKVWVQWGVPGTLGATRVEQPISSGSRRYRVAMQYLAAHIGRVLPVSYGVIDAMDQEYPSVPRRLQVRTLPSNRLEAVQCEGLSGGNLSYNSVPSAGARLTLRKWPLITTDHWVMITMTGVNSSGQDSVFEAVRKRAVTEQETFAGIGFGTEVRVLKAWLNTLRRNAPLTGKAYVSFDGGETWPVLGAPNFPLLQLTLVE